MYIASTHGRFSPNERIKKTEKATESTHGMSYPHRRKLALQFNSNSLRVGR